MKKKQLFRFQFLTLAFLLWGVSASAKSLHANLLSTNREQTKIAASHFHHSLFVEELSSVNCSGEKNLEHTPQSSFFNYCSVATISGTTNYVTPFHFTLQDKRNSLLRLLFPFHFFF